MNDPIHKGQRIALGGRKAPSRGEGRALPGDAGQTEFSTKLALYSLKGLLGLMLLSYPVVLLEEWHSPSHDNFAGPMILSLLVLLALMCVHHLVKKGKRRLNIAFCAVFTFFGIAFWASFLENSLKRVSLDGVQGILLVGVSSGLFLWLNNDHSLM